MKKNNQRSKNKSGFTLLEILVVIGIISLLVSLGISSYSTAQRKARDAKRQSDLVSFQKLLEQCYAVNSFTYPAITGGGTTSISADCTAQGGQAMTITDPTTKTYIVDGGAGSTYEITTTLEDASTFSISQQQ